MTNHVSPANKTIGVVDKPGNPRGDLEYAVTREKAHPARKGFFLIGCQLIIAIDVAQYAIRFAAASRPSERFLIISTRPELILAGEITLAFLLLLINLKVVFRSACWFKSWYGYVLFGTTAANAISLMAFILLRILGYRLA